MLIPMSENTDLLLAGYDAWNRDDCDAWLRLLHPEIEIHTSGAFPDLSPLYRGHERAKKFWQQMREPWESFRIEVERLEELDDCVIGAIRFRATGVDGGVEVDMRFGSAIRLRDGLATEMVNGRTAEEARDAVCQLPVRDLSSAPSSPQASRAASRSE
jgi:ketosteroid isomerase-like protein